MILLLLLAMGLSATLGAAGMLLAIIQLRRRWRAKAIARLLASGRDDAEFIIGHCGPFCEECLAEGWPREICLWLA